MDLSFQVSCLEFALVEIKSVIEMLEELRRNFDLKLNRFVEQSNTTRRFLSWNWAIVSIKKETSSRTIWKMKQNILFFWQIFKFHIPCRSKVFVNQFNFPSLKFNNSLLDSQIWFTLAATKSKRSKSWLKFCKCTNRFCLKRRLYLKTRSALFAMMKNGNEDLLVTRFTRA